MLLAFGPVVKAQYEMPKLADLQEIKNRQPIVIVNPPDQVLTEKYKSQGKADFATLLQQVFEDYNDNMKAAVDKFWTFGKGKPLYKTRDELADMFSDKSEEDKYYLIYCYSYYVNYNSGLAWGITNGGKTVEGPKTLFAIGLPNKKPFFEIWFEDLVPTYVLLAHYISTTNFFFNLILQKNGQPNLKEFANANSDMLPKKTLLIPADKVYPKVINDIQGYYPCHYRLVSDSEMNQAIANADSSCAYLVTSVYGSRELVNWIINCKDGAPIGYSDKGTETVSFSNNNVSLFKNFFADIGRYCNSGQKK